MTIQLDLTGIVLSDQYDLANDATFRGRVAVVAAMIANAVLAQNNKDAEAGRPLTYTGAEVRLAERIIERPTREAATFAFALATIPVGALRVPVTDENGDPVLDGNGDPTFTDLAVHPANSTMTDEELATLVQVYWQAQRRTLRDEAGQRTRSAPSV